MKATLLSLTVVGMMTSNLTVLAAQPPEMKMTTAIPASVTAPNKAETSIGTLGYFDGVPSAETVGRVYDYLDRSRAVNVYLNSIPALSINALRGGRRLLAASPVTRSASSTR